MSLVTKVNDAEKFGRAMLLPVSVGLGILLGHVGLLYRAVVSHTDGSFCYPLDDAFIHMAIGRTLAQHGLYGVTPHGFTSASSSILWPVLLALVDVVFGDRVLTPLLLNVVLGGALVAYLAADSWRVAPHASPLLRSIWLAVVIALIPLPTMVVIGMEHTAHILASVMFVATAASWLSSEHRTLRKRLLFLGALATSLRYESLFLVAIVSGCAVLRRRFGAAASLTLAAAVPVVLFGFYSVAHGWAFLPNSVLLKGNRIHFLDISDVGDFFGGNFVTAICAEPHMLTALVGASALAAVAIRRDGLLSPHALRISISVFVAAAHVQFASLSWFFRYEAYAVTLLVANAGLFLLDAAPSFLAENGRAAAVAVAVASSFGLAPLIRRAIWAAERTPSASRNIFDQQVQTARFLKRFFSDGPVAVNDIGAVAYFGGEPIVDLVGLASFDAARSKHFEMSRPLTTYDVDRLTERVPVAILYDEWVPKRPPMWTLLGRWNIESCQSCFAPTVSIYATRPQMIPRVHSALKEFTSSLPEDVRPEGLYMDSPATATPDAPEYLLSEGDTLAVTVPGLDPQNTAPTVWPDGRLPIPYAKPIRVERLHVADVAARVDEALAQSDDPRRPKDVGRAEVRLVEPRSPRFAVIGNVYRPGEFRWRELPSVETLIRRIGGRTSLADLASAPYAYRLNGGVYERISITREDAVHPFEVLVFP